MAIRTSTRTVTFRRPFVLGGFDEMLPAGAYRVETDEELLEGISFPAYRRILTLLHLHSRPGHPGLSPTLTIDPNELDAALERDRASAELSVGRQACQDAQNRITESRSEEADEQAIERGEDEGMVVHSR
ncbi:MAG: hypothetical protein O7H40_11155 [Gammaproteobacteria bacterium]|nr:hypothetical protein [Gammaproteobacteria bacterium]